MSCPILRNRILSCKKNAILALLVLALPAWGELGGSVASIKADQEKIKGSVQVTSTSAYQVHEIQSAQGVKVREYVAPGGTVFGVAWEGPWKPDLKQLLGPYFEQYVQAAQGAKTTRGPATIELPGLVVETGGHQRSFFGRAYLPQMVPQSVSTKAIK
jgi:hypothetical protein